MTIILAASFDELTGQMLSWLSKFNSDGINPLLGESASRSNLLAAINEDREIVTLVFYGHGVSFAFLTASHLGSEHFDGNKSCLCRAEDFESVGSVHIFAYCCLSSLDFGDQIRRAGRGNRFIGYRREIPFSVAPVEADAFERPLVETIRHITEIGEIDDDAISRLMSGYQEEHGRWFWGEYSNEDRAMMICMLLEDHMASLDKSSK
jgi:hypothetical protein